MAYTTPGAIITGLESVIIAITPTGDVLRRKAFRRASTAPTTWETRAGADVDREFSIEGFSRGGPLDFGNTAEYSYTGSFNVTIGHFKTGDIKKGEIRRLNDIGRIQAALENKDNYPAAVWLIRLQSDPIDPRDIKDFWLTTLTFKITCTLQA